MIFRKMLRIFQSRMAGDGPGRSDNVPFMHSYWVNPDKLLAGVFPGGLQENVTRERMEKLFDCGIRHVINLMESEETDPHGIKITSYRDIFEQTARSFGEKVICSRHAIVDMNVPDPGLMKTILDEIDLANEKGRAVYVHCLGGVGRTGTVVGCYLIRHKLASEKDVFEKIRMLRGKDAQFRGPSPVTDIQRKMVQNWKMLEG